MRSFIAYSMLLALCVVGLVLASGSLGYATSAANQSGAWADLEFRVSWALVSVGVAFFGYAARDICAELTYIWSTNKAARA